MNGISRHYREPEDEKKANDDWCETHGVQLTDAPVFAKFLMRGLKDSNEVARLKKAFLARQKIETNFKVKE